MTAFERFGSSKETTTVPDDIYNATISHIEDVTDRVRQYADLGIELTYNVEGLNFEVKNTIFIKFDRLPNGTLDPQKNTWTWQFNNLLDTLKCTCGFDNKGVFRDQDGEATNLVDALAQAIYEKSTQDYYPFVIYLYKDKKGYMAVGKRIFTTDKKALLEEFVNRKPKQQQPQTTNRRTL